MIFGNQRRPLLGAPLRSPAGEAAASLVSPADVQAALGGRRDPREVFGSPPNMPVAVTWGTLGHEGNVGEVINGPTLGAPSTAAASFGSAQISDTGRASRLTAEKNAGMGAPTGMFARSPLLGAPMADAPISDTANPITAAQGVDLNSLKQPIDFSKVKTRGPGFHEPGGWGEKLEILAAALMGAGGNQAGANAIFARQAQRKAFAREDAYRQQQRQWELADQQLKMNAPQYFMSGRDRVLYDPTTGASNVVYDGPEDYQTYADTMGLRPGDEGYDTAVQDFVLRSNGPTAFGYRQDLEGTRQENRVGLEGIRQQNRQALRSAPTYRDLHPRPASGGGRSSAGRTGYADVYAPILAKVARGEALTPGEQQALSMRGGRGGKGYSNGRGQIVTPGGGAPRRPGTRENPAVIANSADRQYLPKGTYYRDPQGNLRVKQ